MTVFRKTQILRTEEARQVFRQFSWNLAGLLAAPKRCAPTKPANKTGRSKRPHLPQRSTATKSGSRA